MEFNGEKYLLRVDRMRSIAMEEDTIKRKWEKRERGRGADKEEG